MPDSISERPVENSAFLRKNEGFDFVVGDNHLEHEWNDWKYYWKYYYDTV